MAKSKKMSEATKAKLRSYKKKGKGRKSGKRKASAWAKGFGECGKQAFAAVPGKITKASAKRRKPIMDKCLAALRKRLGKKKGRK